ncbi:MAG TPA: TolC family protein [Ignavibacteriaceae bacterium]|nr:TolC family protein [Ignavibacteriaceae bacterium]
MKRLLIISVFLLSGELVKPQTTLTLDECYNKSRDNYPLIIQKEYIVKSKDYTVSNIWNGYFPQITISGQATYQSDVTTLPISVPGITIDKLTKEQYKVVADVSQVIYDGGIMSFQSDFQNSLAEVDDQKLEIELLKVKESVNQIYFGILLLDAQLKQIGLLKNDLNESLLKLNAALENGTTIKSNVDVVRAELLKANQKEIELNSSRIAFIQMLGLLINQSLDESTKLEQPILNNFSSELEITRPELKLFSSQQNMITSQDGLTISKVLPKASLFFQGGYGKPGLNMLLNEFDWFYIAGVRLTLSLSNLYNYENEKEINELNKKNIEAQKQTFVLNTNISVKQHLQEIDKLKKLIAVDREIIDIRTSVKESAKAQLENGVITSNDFIRELNAEDTAKQSLAIHIIQLLLAQYNYKITIGN